MHSLIFKKSNKPYCGLAILPVLLLINTLLLQGICSAEVLRLSGDPYLWLEDIQGKKALDWVKEQNAASTKELEAVPGFEKMRERLLSILNSKDHIPMIMKRGKYYYNFWRDDKNERGLWRRTTLEEYKKAEPAWEVLIDLDKLAADEKENWVWHGASFLEPDYDLALVSLSRGGTDADVVREYDVKSKAFVKDGFTVPEAKSTVNWRDRNTLYVATDFGPASMTKSGYPRIVKEWKRGTKLADAKLVYEGKVDDMAVSAEVSHDHGKTYEFLSRQTTFFSDEMFLRKDDKWVPIEKQPDAQFGTMLGDYAYIRPRTDWKIGDKTYKAGSLLIEKFDNYMKGDRNFTVLFEPTERKSLYGVSETKNYLILSESDNVRTHAYVLQNKDGKWERTAIAAPELAEVGIYGVDPDESDDFFMTIEDLLTPSSFYIGNANAPSEKEKLKSEPSFFKSDNLVVEQFEVKSKDGTRVPYFQVSPKGMKLDGNNPTVLYGYGGFEISMKPNYRATEGSAWLEQGGVWVLANIRGGGEFGPQWHESARKENRQRAYDDFSAVAKDLIARKVCTPQHLGAEGRSNGGLLMGVMLTKYPELFGAIHCGSPLLDMQRYNKLLAGASWVDEYGDPDKPDEWQYISKYSPYQNITKEKKYPPILITTSTLDDRVHPGHARKMVALLKDHGQDVLYYENTEGGHGAAANKKQSAFMSALAFSFFWEKLKK